MAHILQRSLKAEEINLIICLSTYFIDMANKYLMNYFLFREQQEKQRSFMSFSFVFRQSLKNLYVNSL